MNMKLNMKEGRKDKLAGRGWGIAVFLTLAMLTGLSLWTAALPAERTSAAGGRQCNRICPNGYLWPDCSCRSYPPGTTPTPTPTSTPKGAGVTYNHCEDCGAIGVGWQYNWSPNPSTCNNVEGVPMIWGRSDAEGLINGTKTLGGNSRYILGFNEPDLSGQANLSPQEAADLWYQIEIWLGQEHPGIKLVAPAPSQIGYEWWLPQFREVFMNTYGYYPHLDALAAHCYEEPSNWTDCQSIIQWFENKVVEWNISGGVWVTEYGFPVSGCTSVYGCNWSPGVTALNDFTDWLQARSLVRRYAWFATRIQGNEWWWGDTDSTTRLIQCPDGSVNCGPDTMELSPLGTAYATQ